MHNKKLKYRFTSVLLAMLLTVSTLTACTVQNSNTAINSSSASTVQATAVSTKTNTVTKADVSVQYDTDDENSVWSSAEATDISLKTNSITWDGDGVTVKGNKVTITSAGTYILSGSLNDGQILVNTQDKETVRLVLNGTDISSSDSAPIYVANAKKTVIILAEGTKNNLKDGKTYIIEDKEANEPNSTIFAKSDLTINGTGSLTVNANYKNAILSKDELKIMSGNITVNSAGDGIQGRDFVAVRNGIININAQKDGMKSTNDEAADKGFVLIEGGTINITAQEDGIQAKTNVWIKTGDIKISSGGGSANGEVKTGEQPGMGGFNKGFDLGNSNIDNPNASVGQGNSGQSSSAQSITGSSTSDSTTSSGTESSESDSKKGIKADVDITVDGGTIEIDSADDSLHSNNSISINGGTITAASGDDGIHADTSIEINKGDINITKSYEGIESANITINDGNIHINAGDDGINVSGGADGSSMGGRPGQNSVNTSGSDSLNINGGYIYVDSTGDSLDANGSIYITNGTVLVNGPTANNNGALDYDGAFKMTGGFLIAAGSSGMAQAPDTSSTQNSAMISFTQTMSAGTMVHIESNDGKDLVTFVPVKDYQTVVISSPELKKGTTYDIYYGGSSTGTVKDGLYTSGNYSGGTKYESFTVSDVLTTIGTAGRGGPGGQGFGGGKR
ncbi:MAG: hypothetical protein K0R50_2520 [Eubacterium sp.]|jgi:hypothetical protein|nr:hypothetical protein [Eubacterium sp.]